MRSPLIIDRRPKRRRLTLAAVILVLLALAVTVIFLKRQDLRDLYWRRQQGPIPPALTLEEIRGKQNIEPTAPEMTVPELTEQPAAMLLPDEPAPEPAPERPAPADEAPPDAPSASLPEPETLPTEMNLLVPMVYQAPFAVWDAVHDDACEEAAILMIQAYMNGENSLSREEMDRRLLAVVDHEMEVLGYFESTDAATTADIMREFLGLATVKVLPVNSINDVKEHIAAGRPVILPADGKALKNPNFRDGGPVYHMLVAKGFKPGKIITNEPGTRLGADYVYDEQLLFDAIHDWNGGDTPHGAKVMIIVE